jgi:hypothetical protein
VHDDVDTARHRGDDEPGTDVLSGEQRQRAQLALVTL